MAKKVVKNTANRVGLPRAKKPETSEIDNRPRTCRHCRYSYGPRCKVNDVDEYFMCKCSADGDDGYSKFVDGDGKCLRFEYRPYGDELDTKYRKGGAR